MARIIEFRIPENYRPQTQVIIAITRGEMIQFPAIFGKNERLIGSGRPSPDSSINTLILDGE